MQRMPSHFGGMFYKVNQYLNIFTECCIFCGLPVFGVSTGGTCVGCHAMRGSVANCCCLWVAYLFWGYAFAVLPFAVVIGSFMVWVVMALWCAVLCDAWLCGLANHSSWCTCFGGLHWVWLCCGLPVLGASTERETFLFCSLLDFGGKQYLFVVLFFCDACFCGITVVSIRHTCLGGMLLDFGRLRWSLGHLWYWWSWRWYVCDYGTLILWFGRALFMVYLSWGSPLKVFL